MTELRNTYITGASGNLADVDLISDALITIDAVHHHVHNGSHYTFTASSGDIDNGETLEYLVHTPDTTKWIHMLGNINTSLHGKFEFFEGATHTSGIHMPVHNNNRNSTNLPGAIVTEHANDGSDGLLLYESEFGVSTHKAAGGGSTRADAEWIFKQNTVYLLRLTSLADNNVGGIVLAWYELTSLG